MHRFARPLLCVDTTGTSAQPAAPEPVDGDLILLTWNVLADALSDAFPLVPAADLDWAHRGPRILAELTDPHGFGRLPDLLCLQEVDHFDELARELGRIGFVGKWLPKAEGRDGVALFHRPTALERVELDEPTDGALRYVQLTGEPATQVALFERFRRPDGSTLLVATTHLRAKSGFEAERTAQTQQLCAALARIRRPGEPLIVAGDFNDTPDSAAVGTLLAHPLGLASAYRTHHSLPQAWTTWKIREHETRKVIDYVFHSAELAPVALLDAPAHAELGPQRLPERRFPSDHLNLVVRFRRA